MMERVEKSLNLKDYKGVDRITTIIKYNYIKAMYADYIPFNSLTNLLSASLASPKSMLVLGL